LFAVPQRPPARSNASVGLAIARRRPPLSLPARARLTKKIVYSIRRLFRKASVGSTGCGAHPALFHAESGQQSLQTIGSTSCASRVLRDPDCKQYLPYRAGGCPLVTAGRSCILESTKEWNHRGCGLPGIVARMHRHKRHRSQRAPSVPGRPAVCCGNEGTGHGMVPSRRFLHAVCPDADGLWPRQSPAGKTFPRGSTITFRARALASAPGLQRIRLRSGALAERAS